MDAVKQYLWNILWALDRLGNAILGGSSKEFISTRIYEYRLENRVAWWAYRFLDWLDPGHCERAAHRDYDPDHTSDAVLK